jgi:hypothetical protein
VCACWRREANVVLALQDNKWSEVGSTMRTSMRAGGKRISVTVLVGMWMLTI